MEPIESPNKKSKTDNMIHSLSTQLADNATCSAENNSETSNKTKSSASADGSIIIDGDACETFHKCLAEMRKFMADYREHHPVLEPSTNNEIFDLKGSINNLTKAIENLKVVVENQGREILSGNQYNVPDFNFPLQTEDSLKLFNQKLSDEVFKKSVIKSLAVFGGDRGNNVSKIVFPKLMNWLFQNELLIQYSWMGKKSSPNVPAKKPFLVYADIIDLIFDVVLNACGASYSKIENIKNIQNYLKGSVTYQVNKSNSTRQTM